MKCPRCNGTGAIADDRDVGAAMRERRQMTGKTLDWMAGFLGLSKSYLSDLELGKRHWNSENVERYERAIRA